MIPLVWVWIWDGRQHRVTHPLLFTNNVWVFNVPQTLLYVQGVVRRVYRQGFFEKTRESNRFQTFYKDNTFYSVKDPECWSGRVFIHVPFSSTFRDTTTSRSAAGAPPTELTRQRFTHLQTYKINSSSKLSFTCWHIGWLSNTRYW